MIQLQEAWQHQLQAFDWKAKTTAERKSLLATLQEEQQTFQKQQQTED